MVDHDSAKLEALRGASLQLFSGLDEARAADFDAFVIATPSATHAQIAESLLSLRKPLLIEKPLALNARDGRRLLEAAERVATPIMVGHLLLFHPAIRRIKELIDGGKIGKLQYIYSNRLNLGAVRTEENILWSFAPHDVTLFQYLIGSQPSEVVARGAAFVQPHLHDSTMMMLSYPNNVVGHIFVSWLHPFKEHRVVVIGSKGMLSFEDSSSEKRLLFYEKGVDIVRGEPVMRDGATEEIPYERSMPLTEELKYFVRRLGDGRFSPASGRAALEALEVLERAGESLRGASAGPSPATDVAPAREFFAHESAVVDEPAEIGAGTKIWHFSHVSSKARIGRNCSLGQNVFVAPGVIIGDHVKIQNNVSLYEGVELEDYVFCGPSMVFTNIRDPRSKYPQRGAQFYHKTLVREGASLGANSTVVCGTTIGRHAFVAAGATVTRDVPDYALMMGVPARRVGWMCECGARLGEFAGKVACERCARLYVQVEGQVRAHV